MSDTSTATAPATEEATIDTETGVEEAVRTSGSTDVAGVIASLNNLDEAFYTSIKGTDFATRKSVAKALTTSVPIDENLGKTIALRNVILMPVEIADDDGNVNTAPRIVMIDNDGVAYHAISIGLLTAVRNLFASVGEPDSWPEPIDVKIVKEGVGTRKYFTLNLV
jgi:hypothetical protein